MQVDQVIAQAREVAALRLRRAAVLLAARVPSHGVLFQRLMRRADRPAVEVLFVWPGILRERVPGSVEVIAETPAAAMLQARPRAAHFMVKRASMRPLRAMWHQPAQAARERITFDAYGVLRVLDARTREVLA